MPDTLLWSTIANLLLAIQKLINTALVLIQEKLVQDPATKGAGGSSTDRVLQKVQEGSETIPPPATFGAHNHSSAKGS
jgi:hypothetical protein